MIQIHYHILCSTAILHLYTITDLRGGQQLPDLVQIDHNSLLVPERSAVA